MNRITFKFQKGYEKFEILFEVFTDTDLVEAIILWSPGEVYVHHSLSKSEMMDIMQTISFTEINVDFDYFKDLGFKSV